MKKFILILLVLIGCDKPIRPAKEIPVTDELVYIYNLYPKRDTVRFFNPGQDSFQVTMLFNKISAGFPLPDVVNEVDNALTEYTMNSLHYTPQNFAGDNIINPLGWNFSKDQVFNVAHYKNTLAFLQTDGWVDFTFTGFKIEYYAELFESYGIAGVSVDGGPETMVDLYAPQETNNSSAVFVKDSLENNVSHTIRVRYTKQRNPNSNSQNARINLDKFVTYFHQGTYYVPPVPQPATQQYEQK